MLFFSLANEWHNKWTILFYVSAECVPPRSGSVGSLKRSAEGERNRGNTVRKGESCIKRVTVHPIRTEYGRDALNDTFGECVVAKTNEVVLFRLRSYTYRVWVVFE